MAKENVGKVIDFMGKDSFQNGIATLVAAVADSGEQMRGVRSFLGHSIVEALGTVQMEATFSREEVGILREAIRSYVEALILKVPPIVEPVGEPSGAEELQGMAIPEMYPDQKTNILIPSDQHAAFAQARTRLLRDNLQFPLLGLVIRTAFHTADMMAENADLEIDPKSGLLTWAAAEKKLIAFAEETPDRSCAVFVCDGDGFKSVNDTYSHAAGDAVLRAQSDRIKAGARPGDIVARLGSGDEAIHVAFDVNTHEVAAMIAQRHVKAVSASPVDIEKDDQTIPLHRTVSVGGAIGRIGDWQTLVKEADLAQYRAKGAIFEGWIKVGEPLPAGMGGEGRDQAWIYPDEKRVTRG